MTNIAYTGKAALEMEKASGSEGHTIDSFLNRYNRNGQDPLADLRPSGAQGGQVVIRVDEASLVGGRQAEHILKVIQDLRGAGIEAKVSLIGDTKQLPSIQASPFFSHAVELARGGEGDYTVMKEIVRQKDADLLEVATTLNRDRGERLGANAADALKLLEQQGRVREIPTHDALVRATVERYQEEAAKSSHDPAAAAAGEKQTVLIVTPLNADRLELNQNIHESKMRQGELGVEVTARVFVPVEQTVTVSGYKPGMSIIFTGERRKDGTMDVPKGAGLNQQGKVLSVDQKTNTVAVVLQDQRGNAATRYFQASKLARKSALYREEERGFAAGDTVICNKTSFDKSIVSARSGKMIKIRNGERGVIEAIDRTDKGNVALIRFPGERVVKVNLDRFGPQHLDHGYVVTTYKAEGETIDSVISFNYVPPVLNQKNALQALTGIETGDEQFRRWNESLTDYEKGYRLGTIIGGHQGEVSFVMVADRQNVQEQKGIAVTFANGPAVVNDEGMRQQMREAGMHWSSDRHAWVTAAVNDRAMEIMSGHPLKDRNYLTHIREELKVSPPGPAPSPPVATGAVRAEIDTGQDAERYGRASYNLFNIALTRPKHEATVFTNSLPGLKKAVQAVDAKTTSITNEALRQTPPRPRAKIQGHPPHQPQKPAGKTPPLQPAQPVKAPVRELAKELVPKGPKGPKKPS